MTIKFVYVMRTCGAALKSRGGFQWPKHGKIEATDWKHTGECGNGLHGWLWGEGDGSLGLWGDGAKVLVVKVRADELVKLGADKCKFRRGTVVYCGDANGATQYLHKRIPKSMQGKWRPIAGTASAGDLGTASAGDLGTASAGYRGTASAGYRGTASAGDRGTASAGDRGTASAGDRGTASAGDLGTASAGDRGTASAGDLGTASAGDLGTASAGYRGTASAGDRGTASAGDLGTASAGYRGTASAGDRGTASAGYRGTASAGDRGTASAGDLGTASAGGLGTASAGEDGVLIVRYHDGKRWRIAVGYPGEKGIEKGKRYHVVNGELIEGEEEETKKSREYAAEQSAKKPADRDC